MTLRLCFIFLHFIAVFGNSTVYSLIRNGDFERYGVWIVSPVSAWCDRWCGGPSQWTENAGNYILLAPKSKTTVTQNINNTLLNISRYDSCDLIIHVRAVNPMDIVFNIIWSKTTINLNWATYLSTLENSPSEWIEMHFVLTTMSDSLQFQLSTGTTGWLTLDNVELFCSESDSWFNFTTWEIAFIVVALLIFYGAAHQLYVRAGWSCCCWRICRKPPEFIPLEEEPEETAIELTSVNLKRKSVLEDSSSSSSESHPKKQKSPFIDE
jgi:hypothetical protein